MLMLYICSVLQGPRDLKWIEQHSALSLKFVVLQRIWNMEEIFILSPLDLYLIGISLFKFCD